MTTDTRTPALSALQIIEHADRMRHERNTKIRRASERRDAALRRLDDASAHLAYAQAEREAAEQQLADMLERGEKKVVGNTLLMLNESGGVHFEPVDVVGLL